jgi:long-chain acyl-CoA synthetase
VLENLGQVLPAAAERYGAKTAFVGGGREFGFDELNDLSDRLANGLRGLGVEPGDRVSLYSQNSWEWVVSYYAIARSGAVINPVIPALTPEEARFIVNDCGAKAVLASGEKGGALLEAKGDPPLEEVILFGDDAPAGARSFEELLERNGPEFEGADTAAGDTSTIGYTSGTTGRPKGAMATHRAVLLNSAMTANMHVRTAADTVVTGLPCAHVYGNVVMNGAFLYGYTLVLLERFDAIQALEAIQRHRATMFEGVPTMYQVLLDRPELEGYDLSSLTRCTVGGQSMPVSRSQEVEERFGCPLIELWGMTEIAGLGTTHPLYGPNKHGSIGRPLPFVECRVADPEDPNETLGPDEPGELMLRGPVVMQGYYGNEEATRETIEPDGWLHSGDVARMDEEGYIHLVDRTKDMIIRGGENVYPREIEEFLYTHPGISGVQIYGVPDEKYGEQVAAAIVLKEDASLTEGDVEEFCRDEIAPYKIPKYVDFVEEFPMTGSGKIQKFKLRDEAVERYGLIETA